MVNYKNGKIYKIICSATQKIYIGSTCTSLSKRLNCHINKKKCMCKDFIEPKIYLIEDYACERKEQLTMRERHYIEIYDCVNNRVPHRTWEEWKKTRPNYFKEYYNDNKKNALNKAKQLNKIKYTCVCGTILSPKNKKNHEKSQKHKNYIQNNE